MYGAINKRKPNSPNAATPGSDSNPNGNGAGVLRAGAFGKGRAALETDFFEVFCLVTIGVYNCNSLFARVALALTASLCV